jgi:hypothetical protein
MRHCLALALLSAGCGAPAALAPAVSPSPIVPVGPPAWSTEFVADEGLWDLVVRSGGRITFGVTDPAASDAAAGALLFPGDARPEAADRVGPGFATELDSKRRFLYGTFRTRVKLATCAPHEDVVNGFFTYFNDGSDANGNGIPDNSELDVEILCGTPSLISLSSWTDYSDARFIKLSRVVDLATGEYFESPSDHEYGLVRKGSLPEFRHLGFEWRATRVRFFIVLDGREIELWNMTDPRYVPQRPSALLFNVWHPRAHWFGPAANQDADYPSQNAEMRIDWVRYFSE